jgi:hypothetical protein
VCLNTRDITNLSVVLHAQHENGQRTNAKHLFLLQLLPKRRQQAQEENRVSYQPTQKLAETTKPESQINKGVCEFWMLTLVAASYAINGIAHKAKPVIWTREKTESTAFLRDREIQ